MRHFILSFVAVLTCTALPASDKLPPISAMVGVSAAPTLAELTVGDVNDPQIACEGCRPQVLMMTKAGSAAPADPWVNSGALHYPGTSAKLTQPPFNFTVNVDMLTIADFDGDGDPEAIEAGHCLPIQAAGTCSQFKMCKVAFEVSVPLNSGVRLSGDGWYGTGNVYTKQSHCGDPHGDAFIDVLDADTGVVLLRMMFLYGCEACTPVVLPN